MNIKEISEELNKVVASGDVVNISNAKAKFIAKILIDKVLECDEYDDFQKCPPDNMLNNTDVIDEFLEGLKAEQDLNEIACEVYEEIGLILSCAGNENLLVNVIVAGKGSGFLITKETLEKIHLLAEKVTNDTAVNVKTIATGLTNLEFMKAVVSGKTCVYGDGADEVSFYMEEGVIRKKYNDEVFYALAISPEELAKMYVRG